MPTQNAYTQAGVDIVAGTRATQLMKTAVQSTYGPEVLSDIGSFGGLYSAVVLQNMASPVLVASTDGVGTKTKVAAWLNQWDTLGYDIVNHCVNDILVQGARPLFFLDYVASSRIHPEQIATIVGGIAAACREAGCALLGGETAEMPGVYQPGEVDLVGTVVGIVERQKLINGRSIQAGNMILGLPSVGLHTNGYSLARRVLDGLDWHESRLELDGLSIGQQLLMPHRSYLGPIQELWAAGVHTAGLAHITGGGLIDNPPRIFPEGLGAVIRRGSWPVLPIFRLIQTLGDIAEAEMYHVFNMGLGMLAVVPPGDVSLAVQTVPELFVVGEIVAGVNGVEIR